MADHQCSEKDNIRQNAESVAKVAGSVSAISTSVGVLVEQVARLTALFERAAVSETEIKAINTEQAAQWRRIDETLREVRKGQEVICALQSSHDNFRRDALARFGYLDRDIKGVEADAKEARDLAEKLEATPGKIVIGYLKHAVTVAITAAVMWFLQERT